MATLVTHDYSASKKRTRTVYLGSFSLDLDPAQIPSDALVEPGSAAFGISLKVGAAAWGEPFRLGPIDFACIKRWLESHGTYVKRCAEEAAAQAEAEESQRISRARFLAHVEADLRGRLEAQWRTEFDAALEHARQRPLDAVEHVLEQACDDLRRRAEQLSASGHRLTKQRSANTDIAAARSPLDALQAQANRIRMKVFVAFESACKDAGVMVGAKRASRNRSRSAIGGN